MNRWIAKPVTSIWMKVRLSVEIMVIRWSSGRDSKIGTQAEVVSSP